MKLYPAIDLLDGKCVRLVKGDFKTPKIYSEDPFEILSSLALNGAEKVHLVDLSGAKDPALRQLQLLRDLAAKAEIPIQCGGGIRSEKDVGNLLELGIDTVVIGSTAFRDPQLTQSLFKKFGGDRIVLAMDIEIQAKGEFKIATEGWTVKSEYPVTDWLNRYREVGLKSVLCTDIARDGLLQGPNVELYRDLGQAFPDLTIQASGGVSQLKDLEDLKRVGVKACIVGKALYEGNFTLKEALALC